MRGWRHGHTHTHTYHTHTHLSHTHKTHRHQGQLGQLLSGIDDLGAMKLPAFFLLWVAAKSLCIDALALVLGLASGVIFGGVLEGTSRVCMCVCVCVLGWVGR